MATIPQRIFAASGAILFFVTSIALSVVVIITIIQDNKNQDKSTTTASKASAGKLEGTKLSGFTPVETVPELKTEDLQAGDGKEVTSTNNTVTADYTGA